MPNYGNLVNMQGAGSSAFDDLWLMKTILPHSNTVEVHETNGWYRDKDPSKYYSIPTCASATAIGEIDVQNGSFSMSYTDLYFVKTSNCASGRVELHQVSRGQNTWNAFGAHAVTGFGLESGANGQFVVRDRALYYIKLRNCASGFVEVHIAYPQDNYATIGAHCVTSFGLEDVSNGKWDIWHEEGSVAAETYLYFIKTKNQASGSVEIHLTLIHQNNSPAPIEHHATALAASEGQNGDFLIGSDLNLYYIKQLNAASGSTEVHILDRADRFNSYLLQTPTCFRPTESGHWSLGNPKTS